MGISSLQKNFVLFVECMLLTINDRACNYYACKKTTNTCPLSTTVLLALITVALRIDAHLFLMTSVLLLSQLLPFQNAVVDKHAARHWLSTSLCIKSAFMHFRHALLLSICERSTFMRMFDSFD